MNDHQLIELIKSADPLATDDGASAEVVRRIRLDDLAEPRSRPGLRQGRRKDWTTDRLTGKRDRRSNRIRIPRPNRRTVLRINGPKPTLRQLYGDSRRAPPGLARRTMDTHFHPAEPIRRRARHLHARTQRRRRSHRRASRSRTTQTGRPSSCATSPGRTPARTTTQSGVHTRSTSPPTRSRQSLPMTRAPTATASF